jgi:hypothetical protein
MGSKFKELVRARMAKTNEGWQTAERHVRAQAGGAGGPPPGGGSAQEPWIAELLKQLHLSTTFGMLVGRVPATGAGVNFALAQAQANELATHPVYFAESGSASTTITGDLTAITRDQVSALVRAGAANADEVQMIRSGNYEGTTFSERCESCEGWIWCGDGEHEGACVCGQLYRVSFDAMLGELFSLRGFHCCVDCGVEWKLDPAGAGLDPGRNWNEWQWQCQKCMDITPKTPEQLEAMHPFKRRRYRAMMMGGQQAPL